jgi:inorganic triphosphatase YgiF
MPTETELKLRLTAAGLRQLRRHPLVQRLKRSRALSRFQKSVYFDTPDFRLRDQQVVLRVRHIGRRRVQTVKDSGRVIGGARTRGEWEWEIIGDMPETAALQVGDVASVFADDHLCRALQPMFSSEIRRSVYLLGTDDWEIELSLDEGQIVAALGSVPVSEAELELKRGQPRHLFDLALQLQEDLHFTIATDTKADRGFALLDGKPAGPQKASSIDLAVDISAADAFRDIARGCLTQFLANQACLIDSRSPESVHQMRVALRRLRSAMATFKAFLDTPESLWLKEELAWLLAPLGAARDADVFLEDIFEPLADILADEPGFSLLREDFQANRQAAYATALELQDTPRLTHLLLCLGRWIEAGDWLHGETPSRQEEIDRPAWQLAAITLARLERKVGRGMRHLADSDSASRHATRIQVKKLRYTIDFFYSLFPGTKAKRLGAWLAVLQDRLGLLNDIAVGRQRLALHAEQKGDVERVRAAGMVAGWHLARVPSLLEQAAGDWRHYDKQSRFWLREK